MSKELTEEDKLMLRAMKNAARRVRQGRLSHKNFWAKYKGIMNLAKTNGNDESDHTNSDKHEEHDHSNHEHHDHNHEGHDHK
jgi:hypothetical protein